MENNPVSQNKKPLTKIILLVIIVLLLLFFAYVVMYIKTATGTAGLSWNANTESDLAGYKIYYGTAKRTADCPGGGYANNIDIGNTTSKTISNLANGATYYFSVTSYDTSGKESCFSQEMSKVVPKATLTDKIRTIPALFGIRTARK